MSDLVERLKEWRDPRINEALREIARLTAEVERLERMVAVYNNIIDTHDHKDGAPGCYGLRDVLRPELLSLDGEPCPTCKGAGRVGPGLAHVNCDDCHGTGRKP